LDASTGYTSYPHCSKDLPERMFRYNKKIKLIYLVRHPLDRIISHYKMSYEKGDLHGSLDEALVSHPILISCGKYYSQLERFLEFFPREQLLVLDIQELNSNSLQNKLIDFLHLEHSFESLIAKDNSSDNDYRMPRNVEGVLKSKLFSNIKNIFPSSVVRYVKSKIFNSLNAGMDTSLNKESLRLLQKELYKDIERLNEFVDLDIDKWKNFNDYQ